jgi:hypothetical protein
MKHWLIRSLVGAIILTGLSPAVLGQTVLFTTMDDFTGWAGTGFSLSPVTSPDLDGATVNGLGNTTSAGSPGTAGALRLFETSPFIGSAFALSDNLAANSSFMSTLLSAGTLTLQYQTVPSSDESSLQLLLAFRTSSAQNGFSGIAPVSTTINGGVATSTYDLTGGLPGNTGWFQLGVGTFNNFDPSSPIYLDNFRISGTVPEPSSGALIILGSVVAWPLLRHRLSA